MKKKPIKKEEEVQSNYVPNLISGTENKKTKLKMQIAFVSGLANDSIEFAKGHVDDLTNLEFDRVISSAEYLTEVHLSLIGKLYKLTNQN